MYRRIVVFLSITMAFLLIAPNAIAQDTGIEPDAHSVKLCAQQYDELYGEDGRSFSSRSKCIRYVLDGNEVSKPSVSISPSSDTIIATSRSRGIAAVVETEHLTAVEMSLAECDNDLPLASPLHAVTDTPGVNDIPLNTTPVSVLVGDDGIVRVWWTMTTGCAVIVVDADGVEQVRSGELTFESIYG